MTSLGGSVDAAGRFRLSRKAIMVLLGSAIAATIGCGSLTIPTVAVEGTTITLMVPNAYPTGYGRTLVSNPVYNGGFQFPAFGSDPDHPEDPQRGELMFELVDSSGAALSPRRFLQVEYITRVFPHAGSEGSITQSGLSGTYAEGQTIAMLHIPDGTVPADDDYQIRVTRWVRDDQAKNQYIQVPVQTTLSETWYGWGQDTVSPGGSPDPIPIRILDSAGMAPLPGPTPKSGWADFAGAGIHQSDVKEELDTLVPHPDFVVTAKPSSPPGPPPAAWEVEFTYPRKFIRIESVTSKNTTSGSAMVSWSADQTETVDCMAADDTLRIQVLDPDQTTRSVRVSFSLENYDPNGTETCGRRAVLGDFQEQSGTFKAFDVNGADATSSWDILPSSTPGTFN